MTWSLGCLVLELGVPDPRGVLGPGGVPGPGGCLVPGAIPACNGADPPLVSRITDTCKT